MRIRLGLVGLLVGLAACAADLPRSGKAQEPPSGQGQGAAPDAAVAAFLGAEIADIVARAERVESVALQGRAEGADAVQGYAVTRRGPDLGAAQIERLRELIFAESSYLFGQSKRCPMVAAHGFVFHAGARQASVVVSPATCPLWTFAQGAERPKIEDYDPVVDEIAKLAAELFGASK